MTGAFQKRGGEIWFSFFLFNRSLLCASKYSEHERTCQSVALLDSPILERVLIFGIAECSRFGATEYANMAKCSRYIAFVAAFCKA